MKLNVLKLILDADPVVKLVLLILAFLSVTSWAIIFSKFRTLKKAHRNSLSFNDYFWNQSNLDRAFRKAEELVVCPVAAIFQRGYTELVKSREKSPEPKAILVNVERALRRGTTAQLTLLESRVPFLATTGSSAPFIGLFGTVWGIMNSFLSIGATGSANLAVVAPGIAEALIATAAGLFAAIPAVIGYNYCVTRIRGLHREMENFTNDFLNIVRRQLPPTQS